MPADKLHPDAQRVCDMIIASGRPPIETLAPVEARAVYLASKAILQPDPEPVAEVKDLTRAGAGRANAFASLSWPAGHGNGGRNPSSSTSTAAAG